MTLVDYAADSCTPFTPMPAQGSAEARRLGRAFAAASRGAYADALVELHSSVDAFVAARAGAGQPPERVIVALKIALFTFGGMRMVSEADPVSAASDQQRALYDDVFRWTVAAYYDKK